jgi:hypothetical protein
VGTCNLQGTSTRPGIQCYKPKVYPPNSQWSLWLCVADQPRDRVISLYGSTKFGRKNIKLCGWNENKLSSICWKILNYFIQIDRGVTRDRIYLFDISTMAEFLRDTLQNFDNVTEILCSRGGGGYLWWLVGGSTKAFVMRDIDQYSTLTEGSVTHDCRFEWNNSVGEKLLIETRYWKSGTTGLFLWLL